MNKNNAISLAVVAGFLALTGASFAVSGVADGVDASTLSAKTTTASGPDARIHLAQAEAARASYASDQADRGETTYEKECVECHGDDLRGGLLGGPPLRGVAFEEKYANGSPAGVLFEVMSGTMPPNAPGRYSAATYADIMAYLLKRNGFAAGAPLPDNVDALYELVIEK